MALTWINALSFTVAACFGYLRNLWIAVLTAFRAIAILAPLKSQLLITFRTQKIALWATIILGVSAGGVARFFLDSALILFPNWPVSEKEKNIYRQVYFNLRIQIPIILVIILSIVIIMALSYNHRNTVLTEVSNHQ